MTVVTMGEEEQDYVCELRERIRELKRVKKVDLEDRDGNQTGYVGDKKV